MGGVLSFQEKRGEGSWSQEDARMDASLSAVQPSVSIHRSANDEVNGSRCEEIFCVFRFGEWKNIIMDGYLSIDVSLFVFFLGGGKVRIRLGIEPNPSRSTPSASTVDVLMKNQTIVLHHHRFAPLVNNTNCRCKLRVVFVRVVKFEWLILFFPHGQIIEIQIIMIYIDIIA